MTGGNAMIAFDDVSCARGGRLLFEGVSFSVAPGAAMWVRGPNGIGKSSLLRLAAGLLRPAAGRIERRAALALADENPALDRELTLRAALLFWARVDARGMRDVDAALDALDIAHLADVPVRILSTGQRRRAGLARTLASGAALWLLDEPANGLDTAAEARLTAAIAAHRASGGAMLYASHQSLDVPGAAILTLDGALA